MTTFKLDQVLTNDGSYTIRHPVYDEEFHSRHGARQETIDLYMVRSGYQDRLYSDQTDPIGVLDVGLGLGYNALMTLEFWMRSPGLSDVDMLSLEHTEALVEAMTAPDTAWKEGWSDDWRLWSGQLIKASSTCWSAEFRHSISGRRFSWTTLIGDALDADFAGRSFDFIWQDAFSSKKNPELWTPEWFGKISCATEPSACLVTYSVARLVRDNLEASGWRQERIEAGGTKRQWLRAYKS